eukprot:4821214-Amphidinium_carterae.1
MSTLAMFFSCGRCAPKQRFNACAEGCAPEPEATSSQWFPKVYTHKKESSIGNRTRKGSMPNEELGKQSTKVEKFKTAKNDQKPVGAFLLGNNITADNLSRIEHYV